MAMLDEDDKTNDEKGLHNNFIDAHGVLFEIEEETAMLCDEDKNHIGIGFAWNKESVRVTEILTKRSLAVT